MPRDRDVHAAASEGGKRRPNVKAWVIVAWVVLGCVALLTFEEALNLIALNTFPHHDTAACAGADTFCSPDGKPGLTGGAGVFLVGNLAVVVLTVTLARLRTPQRAAS